MKPTILDYVDGGRGFVFLPEQQVRELVARAQRRGDAIVRFRGGRNVPTSRIVTIDGRPPDDVLAARGSGARRG